MKTLPKGFTIRGGAGAPGQCSRSVRRAIEILEKLPFQELVTLRQLSELMGVMNSYMSNHSADPQLASNRFVLASNAIVYGSKRTIAELKKLNAENR